MAAIRVTCSGETVLLPPRLPDYLSDTFDLKPIRGRPADEDIKIIHAVIRSQNAMAHLPKFHNPDLSMQLSQHLFGAQMAIYRANYSKALLPGDKSVYTPPNLPSHIPGTLNQVVGVPSDVDIKSAQSALRSVDGLATYPQLFDADLGMRLSQHLFNLQFAQYMHDSSKGQFTFETESGDPCPAGMRPIQETRYPNVPQEGPDSQGEIRNVSPTRGAELDPQALSELAQLRETMKDIKQVLENMNRVLTLIKRDQSIVGCVDKFYHVYKNPLNQYGVAASEYGLPQLRYGYFRSIGNYELWLSSKYIVGYLKFFGIGADLIQDGEEPKLINGKEEIARRIILKHIDVQYA